MDDYAKGVLRIKYGDFRPKKGRPEVGRGGGEQGRRCKKWEREKERGKKKENDDVAGKLLLLVKDVETVVCSLRIWRNELRMCATHWRAVGSILVSGWRLWRSGRGGLRWPEEGEGA